MARIRSNNAYKLAQVTAHAGCEFTNDKLVHLTLTLTSDGRILRQCSFRHGVRGSKRVNRSSNKIVARIEKSKLADLVKRTHDDQVAFLRHVLARAFPAYTLDTE